jgi:hypothetical protein
MNAIRPMRPAAIGVLWTLTIALLVAPGCRPGEEPASLEASGKQARSNPLTSPVSISAKPDRQQIPKTREARPDDWFEDMTEKSGVDFTYRNGREAGRFLMIESFGGGCAMLDFDLDDRVDLYLAGPGTISKEEPLRIGGEPGALYRNLGEWRFTNVSQIAGLDVACDYSQGCASADYNGDGFPDLLVCAYGRTRLFVNLGDGTFEELGAECGLPTEGFNTAAAFGDFDRDGLPDLMTVRYTDWSPETDVICHGGVEQARDLCGPTSYPTTPCILLRNDGAGGFEDWSERLGKQFGVHGLGVAAADLNLDGWVDFFVSSDAMPNQLYLGGPNGLVEQGVSAGVAYGEWGQPEANMGIEIGDYNGDGLPDIFITHFENEDNALYRNLGNGLWVHSTVAAGLSGTLRTRVGFGTAMADFDHDGWQDIFVLNGNTIYTTAETPYEQAPQLFRNLGGKRFADISSQGGPYFDEKHSGRGNLLGDIDNDGGFDMATASMNDPVRLLRGRQTPENYVRVRLAATKGERDGTGARLVSKFAGRELTRFAVRGAGYFSQFDTRVAFPLDAAADEAEVTVLWPGRGAEVFRGLAPRQTHCLVEGRGEAIDASR